MDLNLDIFKISSNNTPPAKGKILIAEPFLQGYYFSRSIILLTEHNKNGSVGFILNKPLDITLDQVLEQVQVEDHNIACGGPVSSDKLFYIHTFKNIPDAVHISGELYWGGDFNTIIQCVNENPKGKIRFFIGYSGWSDGQLYDEIDENSWLVSETSIDNLLELTNDDFWKEMVLEVGNKYAAWANYPLTPEMN